MTPIHYCFTAKNAVPEQTLVGLRTFITGNLDAFETNVRNAARRSFRFDASTVGLEQLQAMKTGLARMYHLGDYVVPPRLKDFIGHVVEGGAVHEHVDHDLVGRRHVRVNVLIRAAEGCVPLMEGIPLEIGEGDAWLNLASKCRHGTTAVVGSGYRGVVSFGYQIEPGRGDELLALHAEWRRSASTPLAA